LLYKQKNQLIPQNMLCQQNLTSQDKYMVTTQQKRAVSVKIDIYGLKMATEGIGVCK